MNWILTYTAVKNILNGINISRGMAIASLIGIFLGILISLIIEWKYRK
jgi:GTP-sensing pleiotropic transcriptional regulator CodY